MVSHCVRIYAHIEWCYSCVFVVLWVDLWPMVFLSYLTCERWKKNVPLPVLRPPRLWWWVRGVMMGERRKGLVFYKSQAPARQKDKERRLRVLSSRLPLKQVARLLSVGGRRGAFRSPDFVLRDTQLHDQRTEDDLQPGVSRSSLLHRVGERRPC